MNQFNASGNLGSEVELRFMPDGAEVANFSLAINKRWTTGAGEKREQTTWVRVTVWRALAKNCAEFLKKGSKVLITGELAPINTFTKKDGTPGASYEVTASTVEFMDGKPHGDDSGDAFASAQRQSPPKQTAGSDVPF